MDNKRWLSSSSSMYRSRCCRCHGNHLQTLMAFHYAASSCQKKGNVRLSAPLSLPVSFHEMKERDFAGSRLIFGLQTITISIQRELNPSGAQTCIFWQLTYSIHIALVILLPFSYLPSSYCIAPDTWTTYMTLFAGNRSHSIDVVKAEQKEIKRAKCMCLFMKPT